MYLCTTIKYTIFCGGCQWKDTKKERKNVDFPHISDYLSISVDYIAALFLVKLGEYYKLLENKIREV